ncbi:primosomal protein [Demequina sp. TTPB684]|uniref:primosomal protein n=1 Tax=unclassified Demequina TaxID=2620311 RepID=UPI001CF2C999|nr:MULTISPECIES: primosomal protein [unclassified Demequina]MCB2413914.1 primosomal protein [Demequina sp. TTPB684]UPU89398.1 primosomal protein [Demequina sp. TMPB413]
MSTNAREALRQLTGALEAHLEAVIARRSTEDAAVDDAFDAVAEAFERYEDALDSAFGESLPVVLDEFDDGEDEDAEAGDDGEADDDDDDDDEDLEPIDGHAVENEDDMDDEIEEFDLR